jgi:uroporphyrinogen-III synthase
MARILITRAPHQASPLADALRALGHQPILIPTIELAPPTTYAPLDAALQTLTQQGTGDRFHWLLFTSANAVEAFANRLSALKGTGFGPSPEADKEKGALAPEGTTPYSLLPTPCHIAAIGPSTARAISSLLGQQPTLIPPQAIAESLAESLLPHALQPDGTPTRFLLIRAETARDILPEALEKAGGKVTIAPAYRTVIPQESLPAIRSLFHSPATYPDAITFTSSSTATNLLALLEAANLTLPPDIPRISIGPITSQTLLDVDLPPHAEATEPTIASLVETVVQSLTPNP